jgi:hypothetical protein
MMASQKYFRQRLVAECCRAREHSAAEPALGTSAVRVKPPVRAFAMRVASPDAAALQPARRGLQAATRQPDRWIAARVEQALQLPSNVSAQLATQRRGASGSNLDPRSAPSHAARADYARVRYFRSGFGTSP